MKRTGNVVTTDAYGPDGEHLVEIRLRLPVREMPAFLNHFYVVPRKDNLKGSERYKGLGKQMLCKTITTLVDQKQLKPTTMLQLDAAGGWAPKGFTSTDTEESLDARLAPYPNLLKELAYNAKIDGRAVTREDKAIYVESMRLNNKLVEYYKTYGFKVVRDDGTSALMEGPIEGILKACQSGGRRTKTRRQRTSRTSRRRME